MKRVAFAMLAGIFAAPTAVALGTIAGTDINNQATVNFDIGGSPGTAISNTVTVTVAEVLDIDVTLLSGTASVASPAVNEELLFVVTNTGNGSEPIVLSIDNAISGSDDFDPVAATPAAIYFDTDGSGDFSAGDIAYDPLNNPVLAPDASIDVLLVNDIPSSLADGSTGQSELSAVAETGNGSPGDRFAGQGDGGLDAVVGTSGADDAATGSYIIGDITLTLLKSAAVVDPFGGTDPVPGAEITYTVVITPGGSDTATNAVFVDPIPANTTYLPGSIMLNAASMSDAADGDVGEYIASPTAQVSVDLGDLTGASGAQTIEFKVTID